MTRRKKSIIIFLIILIFVVCKFLKVENIFLKQHFPLKYADIIYKYANEYNVDPLIIFSIIKAESNFKEEVVSSSDAIGLMQLLDKTANELAEKSGVEYIDKTSLYNPETNIKLGIQYYRELLDKYNGNNLLVLMAYNAGLGNVDQWIKIGIIKEDGSNIEDIPYKETNMYIRKILRNYRIYNKIYN